MASQPKHTPNCTPERMLSFRRYQRSHRRPPCHEYSLLRRTLLSPLRYRFLILFPLLPLYEEKLLILALILPHLVRKQQCLFLLLPNLQIIIVSMVQRHFGRLILLNTLLPYEVDDVKLQLPLLLQLHIVQLFHSIC